MPIVIVGTKLDKYMKETNANNVIELEDSEYWGQSCTANQMLYQKNKVS